jgi:hypothetical protein
MKMQKTYCSIGKQIQLILIFASKPSVEVLHSKHRALASPTTVILDYNIHC